MPESSTSLSNNDVAQLFAVVSAQLRRLSFTQARIAVLEAGIIGLNIPSQHWAPFLGAVEGAFYQLSPEKRLTALQVLADRFSDNAEVQALLTQHGYAYIDGTFVPIGILDRREARYLPPSSASELAKATKRLIDGDETGTITAACGAIDGLMQQLYATQGLGDPGTVAFAAKVNTALQRQRIFEKMKDEFVSIGIGNDASESIITNMKNATNFAAQALQTLRSRMGDVHGSKPALRRTAYDAIKWASAICGLFEERS